MAGWASNSKWSLVGGMRAAGQQIAYEVPLLLAVLGPVMMAGSMNLSVIIEAQKNLWFVFPQFIAFVVYVIAAQADTQQTPFDMSEAESELITGFANEYGGMRFGFLFLAEFSNMFIVSALGVALFFGGWYVPFLSENPVALSLAPLVFMVKTYMGIFVMMWARGSLPRIRVDQLLAFAWKVLIPVSLVVGRHLGVHPEAGDRSEDMGHRHTQRLPHHHAQLDARSDHRPVPRAAPRASRARPLDRHAHVQRGRHSQVHRVPHLREGVPGPRPASRRLQARGRHQAHRQVRLRGRRLHDVRPVHRCLPV